MGPLLEVRGVEIRIFSRVAVVLEAKARVVLSTISSVSVSLLF